MARIGVHHRQYTQQEKFDPISSSNWTISGGAVQGNGNSEFIDGNALRFSGNGVRSANTIGFDLSSGGNISFDLKIGGNADTSLFENADSGEDIFLNYSNDGGINWESIFVFDTENTDYSGVWGLASFTLDSADMSTNTMFQWRQPSHSGSSYDHWAIDNIKISNNVPEPSNIVLVGLGLAVFGFSRKNRIA